MAEKIKISDFLKAKTVEFIEKVISAFCSRKGLSCVSLDPGSNLPFAPGSNLLFAVGIERCNLEYPGKGKDKHFHSGIRSYLEVHDKHLFLLLKPDNKANEAVKDMVLDLTAVQELQEKSVYEGLQIWLIETAITVAIQLDEEGLGKFKRPRFN